MTCARILAVCMMAMFLGAPTSAFAAKKKRPPPPRAKPAPPPAPAEPSKPEAPPPEPAQPPAPAPAPAPSVAPTQLKAADKGDLDFDLLDKPQKIDAKAAAAAERAQTLGKRRRTMLVLHQALGFTLMGVATANVALGTLNYWDKFGGGGFNNTFELAHLISAMATTAVFTTNGLLALFAPDPYEKPGRWDSARVHRIFMMAATVGMAAQIVLGFISASRLGHVDQRDFARIHLGVGYATYALTMAGGFTYLF